MPVIRAEVNIHNASLLTLTLFTKWPRVDNFNSRQAALTMESVEYEDLYRTASMPIERIDSRRLRQDGIAEERSLREGIEKEIEEEHDGAEKKDVLSFGPGDPENPHNFSLRKKWTITAFGILSVSNSTFGSSLPSGCIEAISKDLGITSTPVATLTISLFLVGYIIGPSVIAPSSEHFGRRYVSIICFAWYTIMTMCCAVAPNTGALLAFRLLAGIGASAPLSVVGGVLADIWTDPFQRGRCMAVFAAVTMIGPALAPVISGFVGVSRLGWRMVFWIGLIVAGLSFIGVLMTPETFAPVLLLKRAKRMRKEGHTNVVAPIELENRTLKGVLTTTLTRPFRMLFKESIVLLTSLFLALIYGTFYLLFGFMPRIFGGIYGFGPGVDGLPFIVIAIGGSLAAASVILWDKRILRLQSEKKPVTDEYRRLPLACIGGLCYCASVFWLGWAANPKVHWACAVVAGLPFGYGFCLIFIAVLNYLTDAYQIYAASALAASSMTRSVFGAVFPLFAPQMYDGLNVHWACSLLGFVAIPMSLVPFLFIKYGVQIRARSEFAKFILERNRMFENAEAERSSAGTSDSGREKEVEV